MIWNNAHICAQSNVKNQAEGGKLQTRLLQSVIKPSADPRSSSPGGLPHVLKSHKPAFKRRLDRVADAGRVNNSCQQCRWPEFWPELQVPAELMAPKTQQRDSAATLNATAISALTPRHKACCRCREEPWRRLGCLPWPRHHMMVIMSSPSFFFLSTQGWTFFFTSRQQKENWTILITVCAISHTQCYLASRLFTCNCQIHVQDRENKIKSDSWPLSAQRAKARASLAVPSHRTTVCIIRRNLICNV